MSKLPLFTTATEEENFKLKKQLEQLEKENAELKSVINKVLQIAQYPPMDKAILNVIGEDRSQSLAEHDKQVVIKAIEDFKFPVALRKMWTGKQVRDILKSYAEQLKQEQDKND